MPGGAFRIGGNQQGQAGWDLHRQAHALRRARHDERASEQADGAAHAVLVAEGGSVTWNWPDDGRDLGRPLWPVAWSATDLLTTGDLQRVKV